MSSSKIITYDLRLPGQHYTQLINAIKSYTDCTKITESCWIVKSPDSCSEIRDNLTKHLDNNDRILVATLSGEAAGINVLCAQDEFTKVLNS